MSRLTTSEHRPTTQTQGDYSWLKDSHILLLQMSKSPQLFRLQSRTLTSMISRLIQMDLWLCLTSTLYRCWYKLQHSKTHMQWHQEPLAELLKFYLLVHSPLIQSLQITLVSISLLQLMEEEVFSTQIMTVSSLLKSFLQHLQWLILLTEIHKGTLLTV